MTASSRRRVAITGVGLVTPLGNDAPTTWDSLLAGRSGVAAIARFDASTFPVGIGAEVKSFGPDSVRVSDRKLLKLANRQHLFALAAAGEALDDARIRPSGDDAERWGCVAGSGMMGVSFEELVGFHRDLAADGDLRLERLLERESPRLDPLEFQRSQPVAGVSLIARAFGIRGRTHTVHTACSSGGQAIGTALELIRRGKVDRALAGGFDSMLNPVGLSAFCVLGALTTGRGDPARASRPFDLGRDGFVLGEGAGFLVLEEWESAERRGARIYAELAGDGNSLSAYRITDSHPSGDGAIQAMRSALEDSGLRPEDIDHINAHGTSTPMNDRSECAAIRAVLGDAADRILVSSTKSLMGHLIAAAGAVEAGLCALAIQGGAVPENANLRERDPACDLRFVTGGPARLRVRAALSNSFGFGGSNNCLALVHPDVSTERARDPGSRRPRSRGARGGPGRARIVITGAGVVCASGRTPAEVLDAVLSGRSAIAPATGWTSGRAPLAGEVEPYDAAALAGDRKVLKLIGRADVLGLHAASRAVESARLEASRSALDAAGREAWSDRSAVFAGSGAVAYRNQYDFLPLLTEAAGDLREFGRRVADHVSPMWLLRTLPNNVLCHPGVRFSLKGVNGCFTNHGTSGALALEESAEAIRSDEADRAVAIAQTYAIEPQNLVYYDDAGILTRDALRPFDAERSGTVLAEGAAAVVLETEASARARDVEPIAELLGFGYASEGGSLVSVREDGEGPARALRAALEDAGLAARDVGLIVSHGNGTIASDSSEARALLSVFGPDPPPVAAFKWAFGHTLDAAGILELILAALALREGVVPGVATLRGLDPAFRELPVSSAPCVPRSDVAILLCRGFGGGNAANVIRAPVRAS